MTALAVFMGATHYLKDSFAFYFDENKFPLPHLLGGGLGSDVADFGNRWIALRCLTLLLLIGLGTAWMLRGNQTYRGGKLPICWVARRQ